MNARLIAHAQRLTLIWELKMMNDKCDRLWWLRRVQTEHREFRSAMLEDENSCQAIALGNAMPPERTGRLKADRELFASLVKTAAYRAKVALVSLSASGQTSNQDESRALNALLHACVNLLSCQANNQFVARIRLLTRPPFDQASKACAYA